MSQNDTSLKEGDQLDWIRVRDDISQSAVTETAKERLIRKTRENPLIPIGSAVTVGALTYGLWSFSQGRRQMSQYMMRLRVGAQSFTILAIIASLVFAIGNKK